MRARRALVLVPMSAPRERHGQRLPRLERLVDTPRNLPTERLDNTPTIERRLLYREPLGRRYKLDKRKRSDIYVPTCVPVLPDDPIEDGLQRTP